MTALHLDCVPAGSECPSRPTRKANTQRLGGKGKAFGRWVGYESRTGIRVFTKGAPGRMLPFSTMKMHQDVAVSEAENDSAPDARACSWAINLLFMNYSA